VSYQECAWSREWDRILAQSAGNNKACRAVNQARSYATQHVNEANYRNWYAYACVSFQAFVAETPHNKLVLMDFSYE
jgi:hypothetical protein